MKQMLPILLLFTLTANSAFVCLSASQNRLFPLEQTPKGLLSIETHLQKTEYIDEERKIEKDEPACFG